MGPLTQPTLYHTCLHIHHSVYTRYKNWEGTQGLACLYERTGFSAYLYDIKTFGERKPKIMDTSIHSCLCPLAQSVELSARLQVEKSCKSFLIKSRFIYPWLQTFICAGQGGEDMEISPPQDWDETFWAAYKVSCAFDEALQSWKLPESSLYLSRGHTVRCE